MIIHLYVCCLLYKQRASGLLAHLYMNKVVICLRYILDTAKANNKFYIYNEKNINGFYDWLDIAKRLC